MNLVFDNNGALVISQKNVNSFYLDNDDYTIKKIDNYDSEYIYSLVNNEVVKTLFTPTEEETQEYENIENKLRYQQPRKKAYPNIAEQLDMLFHDIDNGTLDKTGSFYTALKLIKDNNPKE